MSVLISRISLALLLLSSSNLLFAQAAESCNPDFSALGSWNERGVPAYLEPVPGNVPQSLLDFISSELVERQPLPEVSPSYFSDDVQLNVELTKKSDVWVTFVHEGAGWDNSLGYYVYDTDNPPQTVADIDSKFLIFPNLSFQYQEDEESENVLVPGDRVYLGEFPAGTGIGFFLEARGWKNGVACKGTHTIYTHTQLNTYTTPEYRQQTILLDYPELATLFLSFEDNARPKGDNDFNDAVFFVTVETLHNDGGDNDNGDNDDGDNDNGDNDDGDNDGGDNDDGDNDGGDNDDGDNDNPGGNIPELPTGKLVGDDYFCDNPTSASLQILLTGKAPWTISYILNGDTLTRENIQSTPYVLPVDQPAEARLISVRDKNGLGPVEGTVSIADRGVSAQISGDYSICSGEKAEIPVTLAGEGPWQLTLRDAEKDTTIENVTESPLIYETDAIGQVEIVRVTNGFCEKPGSGMAQVNSNEINGAVSAPASLCFGDKTIAVSAVVENFDGENYNWSTDGQGSFTNAETLSPTYNVAEGESGMITFTLHATGACGEETFTASAEILPQIKPQIVLSFDQSTGLVEGGIVEFNAQSNLPLESFYWEFGDRSDATGNPVEHTYNKAGEYLASVEAEYLGCFGISEILVNVEDNLQLYVPTAFNPDAINPENSVVKVYGESISNSGFQFRIVNRWGSILYEASTFDEANSNGWDGRVGGELQPNGVYTYFLQGQFNNGATFRDTGTITLVK